MIPLVSLARTLARAFAVLWRTPSSRALLTTTGLAIGLGTWFYRVFEDLSWIDALYLTVMTLTTVGYGDVAPTTNVGRLFTVGYVLIGVGLVVSLVAEVAKAAVGTRLPDPSNPDAG